MKKYVWILSLFIASIATAQPPKGNADVGDTYGNISALNSQADPLEISTLAVDKKISGTFTGIVKEVCPKKGCWIKLQLSDGKIATVKMKDYGFFVPVALAGKKILIHGAAELKTTSVAELKHLAEDAKKPQSEIDAITKPAETLTITATGIKVAS